MYLSCNAKLRNCADNIGDNYIIQLINFEGKLAIIQPNYNYINHYHRNWMFTSNVKFQQNQENGTLRWFVVFDSLF